MTYEEIVATINNIRRFGNLSGVEITAHMLEVLHHPEDGMKLIHIAGTNGKGSVSAFLCSIFRQAGKKVGMFTSPHLVDFRERIQINGTMIPKEAVTRIGGELLELDFGVSPTMFDYCLAMALLYFKEQNCDLVILETGLGGRLDSTNAVGIPVVSVITKIGYDHMAILGNTLEEIAEEKAGIIKSGTCLVAESQTAEVESIIQRAAERVGVKSCKFVKLAAILNTHMTAEGQSFSYENYSNIQLRMLGTHQYENAVAALLAAEAYFEAEQQEHEEEYIRKGLGSTVWQGRMEILRKEPFLLVDGAHNSNGVEALRDSLMTIFPGEKFHFVMGVMADKDYEVMVEDLLPLASRFTTVTVDSSRALQAKNLADYIERKGVPAECGALPDCLEEPWVKKEERTVAFGSLYFIGEIEAVFDEKLR